MQTYRQSTLRKEDIPAQTVARRLEAHTPGMPNSAALSDTGLDQPGSPGLGEAMAQRVRRQFLDHQIPSAEQQADELAQEAAGAVSPGEVRARLGDALGADFSGVQFHTDPRSAKAAEAIGARAYTSEKDVYFGGGGFDPAVAAHELVHTAQQGAVDSAVPLVAAPAGGVQMEPIEEAKKRRPGFFKRKVNHVVHGYEHARDDFVENQETFQQLSGWNKAKAVAAHPMAFMASKMRRGKEAAQQSQASRESDLARVKQLKEQGAHLSATRAGYRTEGAPAAPDPGPLERIQDKAAQATGVERFDDALGTAETIAGGVDKVAGYVPDVAADVMGKLTAPIHLVSDTSKMVHSVHDTVTDSDSDLLGKAAGVGGAINEFAGGRIGDIADAVGGVAGKALGGVGNAFGLITDTMTLADDSRNVHQARKARHEAGEAAASMETLADSRGDEDAKARAERTRAAAQNATNAREVEVRQGTRAVVNDVGGIAGNAAGFIPGVGSAVSAGIKGATKIADLALESREQDAQFEMRRGNIDTVFDTDGLASQERERLSQERGKSYDQLSKREREEVDRRVKHIVNMTITGAETNHGAGMVAAKHSASRLKEDAAVDTELHPAIAQMGLDVGDGGAIDETQAAAAMNTDLDTKKSVEQQIQERQDYEYEKHNGLKAALARQQGAQQAKEARKAARAEKKAQKAAAKAEKRAKRDAAGIKPWEFWKKTPSA